MREVFNKINLKNILKRYLLFFVFLLFQEFFFKFVVFNEFELESIINIVLLSSILAALLSIITSVFNKKSNNVITPIILFLIGFLFNVQIVFYNTFKTFFSLTILGLGDQLESFMKETFQAIIDNCIYILVFFLPFIIYLIFRKKINLSKNKRGSVFAYLVIIFMSLSIFTFHMMLTKGNENSTYSLYFKVNSPSLNINKLGVLNSYFVDLNRLVFGFEEDVEVIEEQEEINEPTEVEEIVYGMNTLDISFDKETNNKEIKTINTYMNNTLGSEKNQYTGMFKDYNLVYIVAESFSEIGVSEELTPTLYKLTHSGFIFNNYYTPNTLSTIGGEFQALTGIYPDSSILSKWRKGSNYFPYGLGKIYKDLGYSTFAYHNNWYGFQDRHKYLKSQGFTNYLGCYNGMEKRMNCKAWPQSDLEMMKATMKDYINSDNPFLAYYMTVSGHFSYNFSDNSMANKNKKYVNNLNVSTAAKAYVATQIELDKALEYLITTLEENNKLDSTVIVLLADHYPYKLSIKDVNSLSSYNRDSVVEVNHNNLILWNNNMDSVTIEKVCMSSDVIPTIYNLFGIEFDSRLFTGRDILSTSDGLAIMSNRSWVTDKGTYFANQTKFVPKEGVEVEDDYVSNINGIVKNRLNIGKLIIKNDYYKYLLK